jgi:hypothetical protein
MPDNRGGVGGVGGTGGVPGGPGGPGGTGGQGGSYTNGQAARAWDRIAPWIVSIASVCALALIAYCAYTLHQHDSTLDHLTNQVVCMKRTFNEVKNQILLGQRVSPKPNC